MEAKKHLGEQSSALGEESKQILNSLVAHVAVLDGEGNIIFVNQAWKSFAWENRAPKHAFEGSNYLRICENASNSGDSMTKDFGQASKESFLIFCSWTGSFPVGPGYKSLRRSSSSTSSRATQTQNHPD